MCASKSEYLAYLNLLLLFFVISITAIRVLLCSLTVSGLHVDEEIKVRHEMCVKPSIQEIIIARKCRNEITVYKFPYLFRDSFNKLLNIFVLTNNHHLNIVN